MMATPDTQSEQIVSVGVSEITDQAGCGRDEGFKLMNRVNLPLIAGALAAFLVVLAGFVTGRPYVLLAGAFALAIVGMVWNISGAITLWRMARNWFTARRLSRQGSQFVEGGTSSSR